MSIPKVRQTEAKAELFEGSASNPSRVFTNDNILEISVERVGEEGKFFGFGICQKATIKLLDKERQLALSTNENFRISFNGENVFPRFYITQTHRDETDNSLNITAYDRLYFATKPTVKELGLPPSYSLAEFAATVAAKLGLTVSALTPEFNLQFPTGGNFSGDENLRQVLDDLAEITQTVYYIAANGSIFFSTVGNGTPQPITKEDYFTLKTSDNRRLCGIAVITELGDNTEAHLPQSGTTQYIKDNAFYTVREDVGELLNAALQRIGGTTMAQFETEWRGLYNLLPLTALQLTTQNNNIVTGYLINDNIKFSGGFTEKTQWKFTEQETEPTNPSTIGEAINQTTAKVDKVEKTIDLQVSEANERISKLQVDLNGITTRVEAAKQDTDNEIERLTQAVETKTTPEAVSLEISKAMEKGVDKVVTSTGFRFDEAGMTVAKSGREMKTQITEDGMKIYRNSTEVLTANNSGVDAENLHATTYLIIGNNSRFEDMGERTACYWVRKG